MLNNISIDFSAVPLRFFLRTHNILLPLKFAHFQRENTENIIRSALFLHKLVFQ